MKMLPGRTNAQLVTLTTDFGLSDPYVAEMKGVLLGLNPNMTVVDVSHDVQPQNVLQAAFITQSAWPFFASEAIHVAVVDPGVGMDRHAIVIETVRGVFVGPDNGVLSAALPDAARPNKGGAVKVPDGCRAFEISDARYLRQPVSATFHGRDIFAPAAAHLSLGVEPVALGRRLDVVMLLPALRALPSADGTFDGQVVHIDRFGNIVTDIRADDVPRGAFSVSIGDHHVGGPAGTYGEMKGLGVLVGSSGFLEIAQRNGSAAEALEVAVGDRTRLRPVG